MFKKTILVTVISLIAAHTLFAARLLSKEEALKEMFPEGGTVIEETVELTSGQIDTLKTMLGGSLDHFVKKGASSSEIEKTSYTFYFNMKDGVKTGAAVIEEQPGKWGPVEFIVALNAETGAVSNLAVMAYKEKRGRPIARKNFLKQFIGKVFGDGFKLRKDIRVISGATVSTDCACFAVQKVLALYQVVYLK